MRAGICTPVKRFVKITYDVAWMKKLGIAGIVLWPRVLFSRKFAEVPNWLFRHELEHCYQIIRDGPFRFYLKYFYYSVRYGHHDNPYEVEARDRQGEPLTINEAKLLWKLNES